jgi:hypothetical protein
MSTTNTGTTRSTGYPHPVAAGGMLFAAIMMVLNGLFQFFQGIAAIAKDDIFLSTPNYIYRFNTSTWGWIHLILGIVVALTGFALFRGSAWARGVGIGLVSLQALANFFFLGYRPVWSLVIIALDIFIIWALASAPDPERL